eukprot:ANDGO_06227.mRNA.1 Sphingosine-1-phosphate lyase
MSIVSSTVDFLQQEPLWRIAEHAVAAASIVASAKWAISNVSVKSVLSVILNTVPGARNAVNRQIESEVEKTVANLFPATLEDKLQISGVPATVGIPAVGVDPTVLLERMKVIHEALDMRPETGECFAYVYDLSEKHDKLMTDVYEVFGRLNALNPSAFKSLRKFEIEVVQMSLSLVSAPTTACGTMTSGGTESILCALKTYRDRARALGWRGELEVVAPETVHPAFDKGAHYFGLKVVHVPIDQVTMRPKLADYANAINRHTILLVCSAPQYPHGVVDPVQEIATLARKHQLPLHVDACVGGFVLPWVERLGYDVPLWDFRIPEVTSISADLHKYGFAPKGASVILYRDDSIRRFQFFVYSSWPGGLFASSTVAGTRPGGPIACAWATLHELGQDGYMKQMMLLMETSKYFQQQINSIPHLRVLGVPSMTLVSFASDSMNVHAIADAMESHFGWKLERQQNPAAIHMTVMAPHVRERERIMSDLKKAVEIVEANPSLQKEGSAAMYGMVATIPAADIVDSFLASFLSHVYGVRKS